MNETRDAASFSFQVDPPALLLSRFPDGSSQIRIDGFAGRELRPGVPDLPFHVIHVAIPEGATPRLVVDSVVEDLLPGTMPRVVPRRFSALRADVSDPGLKLEESVERTQRFEPDESIFRGRDAFPAAFARLGTVGVFRDQHYVDVIVTPARFDPKIRGLRVARSLRATVVFDNDRGLRGEPTPDPRLEDLYRSMFTNYAQGMTFRSAPAPEPDMMAAGAAPLAGPRYRVKVRANGIVRLDFGKLNGTGYEAEPLSTYKLTERGTEIPLLIFDANTNDQLDVGDWVQFYGQRLDDEPKTVLNTNIPGGTSIYEARDFTDENVYLLTTEAGPRSRVATRNAPPDLSVPVSKFDAVAHVEVDDAFRPLGGADPWYSKPSQSSPTVAGSPASRTEAVTLPGLASGTDPVRVVVRLRGLTEDGATPSDHKTRITLKNAALQTISINNDDGTFDGRIVYTHDFNWTWPGSGSVLTSPAQVTIDALPSGGSGGYRNQVILDFIDVHYKRTFQASGDALTFEYPDGNAEFQVTGLATGTPEVWEITGRVGGSPNAAPVRVLGGTVSGGAGNFSVRFHMTDDPSLPNGTPRRFHVAGTNAVSFPAPADFAIAPVSDLRNTANQADLIVIGHPTALGATSTTTLNSLLAWKLANQGITSKVAMLQNVYDEFNDGLPGPQAIQKFLAWVLSTSPGEGWSGRKPAWVLLIGDGSYDYKYNDTTQPVSSFLPTQILFKDDPSFGYYASDSILTNASGADTLPDVVAGRISTRTDAQTNIVLQKILSYHQAPPAGNWRRHAVLVSDRGKNYSDAEALDWENTNEVGKDFMKIPPHTQRTMRYWTDYCLGSAAGCTGTKIENLRSDIKKAINGTDGISDGTSILQYTGHGNFNVWSDDAFFAEGWSGLNDVAALVNGVKLPWLIVHNCLTGGFMDTIDVTLGENFVKRSGGGAVAVLAPSGLSDAYNGQDVTEQLWGDVFGRTKERVLGNAVAHAQNFLCGLGAAQACQSYVLLGDPSTALVFPTVKPPTGVVATAGNANVGLTWTASATPGATYDVYRAINQPDAMYAKLNVAPIAATNYADTTAVNAKTYFYYVVALDAAGFDSRWSNFNSDCAVSGPDCVRAAPTNPNPPAVPTGVAVFDPETGAKLGVSWTASPESDLDHYTVAWGTALGVYTSSGNAGKLTTFTISGLTNGVTYYVAVSATNTSGQTSAYTTGVPGIPTFVRGLRSPGFVGTLHVNKSGTNALLSWSPVTTDIYGKPATITAYEVFRGTTPDFVPGPGNKIGQSAIPSFTDPGALAGATRYHWLVRAVDGGGNVGGLGNQLPNGVDVLSLSKTPNGVGGYTLGLSWPAVTTDFNGEPLAIDHYEVYATDHPFSRADIKNGLVPLVGSPATASFSVTAPAASQYYSVLAVDARGNKSSF